MTLVSATGVYAPDQEPFPTEDPGDITYRVIAGDADVGALRIAHHHYDHSEADTDPNIVFPLQSLRELAEQGVIAARQRQALRVRLHHALAGAVRERRSRSIADKVERSKTKLVVLTAGCPETCHRSIANLAREIEARGVPTTSSPPRRRRRSRCVRRAR